MANEMRLIDANQLIRRLEKMQYDTDAIYIDGIIRALKEPSTVDARLVVHGHWEDGYAIHDGKEVYKSIDCSVCNEIFKIESHDREYWKKRFKLCPFCGADMRGDGDG